MAEITQTRAVVSEGETFDGSIIPTSKAELDRPVRVRSGATVLGSIYGADITIDDGAVVTGSVMGRESVEIEGGKIEGEVGCDGRVVCGDSQIGGTVSGSKVRITGSLVLGNVVATEVILEYCSILGLVGADRQLTVEHTLCYTFRTDGTATIDDASLVLPQAIIDGTLEMETPVEVVGVGATTSGDPSEMPTLTAEDTYVMDDVTFLTLAHRVVDLERMQDRLENLEEAIWTAAVDPDDNHDPEEMFRRLTVKDNTLPHTQV
jgi:cytoskeletal protein CcmA (bactofilin family)